MMGSSSQEVSAQQHYEAFWPRVNEEIRQLNGNDVKHFDLPLARIKKIMKMDDDVKMISAEAPALFSKAAEMFITELTMRAWIHTEDNKRRTLQRNDIAMAASKYDQFDFLIDIVPRDENKPAAGGPKPPTTATATPANNTAAPAAATAQSSDQVVYYNPQQQQQVQQPAQQIQQPAQQIPQPAGAPQVIQVAPAANMVPAGGIQIVTQIMGPNGEIQQVPMALTPQQMEMIRTQIAGGAQTQQPLVIQTAPIQAASFQGGQQAQPQQGQQTQAQQQPQQATQQQQQSGQTGSQGVQQVYISE